MLNSRKLLDSKISGLKTLNFILDHCDRKEPIAVSFLNPYSYEQMLNNKHLVNSVDYFFIDGSLLQRFNNFRYPNNIVERLSFDFSSIAHDVIKKSIEKNYSIALVGASDDEVKLAKENILKLYPNSNIKFIHNGFIDDYEGVCNELNEACVDYLFLGMGSPKQEEFIYNLKNKLHGIKIIFTCGGFLSQTAIKPDYYHPLIKKTGLRWLQRMLLHKHVRRRVIRDYPKFIVKYICNKKN